jgi:hypothetical protein
MVKKQRRPTGKAVGFFDSNNPEHILNKLGADYQRVASVPSSRNNFIDFVSTANILIDWTRQQHDLSTIADADKNLLAVCRELANNLKHYRKEETHVSDTVVGGAFDAQAFDPAVFDVGELVLELQGDARKHLGEKLKSDEFAKRVLEFWKAYFRRP